jgi:hypothetical protein
MPLRCMRNKYIFSYGKNLLFKTTSSVKDVTKETNHQFLA